MNTRNNKCALPNTSHGLQVPEGYDSTHKHFAAQGARVIALARRTLPPGLAGPELRALPREAVERGMTFEGFAVFQVGVLVKLD
jgi:magnesium-transporting ATPase (P-type)